MDQRDEIKARLSIVDLVSEYVELKKAGRNFKGLCPFHNEKSPSFVVSPDKEIAYCFGCNKGGDIFGFYQEIEGVDFVQALNSLADKVGVKLEKIDTVKSIENKSKKDKLLELHELAVSIFVENLYHSEEGKKVLAYLRKRGVSAEMIKMYKLGFSLDSFDSLYKQFLAKGFSKNEIVESGLAISKDTDSQSIFDRFRLRLMFPIFSRDGKAIGFGGRALKADENAKYLNSPETLIYHKSETLFGLNFARDEIRRTETVILVEGYFDQIAMFQAGFKNAVAVSGTALTPRHLKVLKKTAKNILFCLDSDSAGREALYRSAELALLEGFNLKVIDLLDYKDPSEFLTADPVHFKESVENAKDFFDDFLEKEFLSLEESERHDMAVLDEILMKVLPLVKKINSNILQDMIIRKIAQVIGVDFKSIYAELKNMAAGGSPVAKKKEIGRDSEKVKYSYEEHFWGYVFCVPEVFSKFVNKLMKLEFMIKEKSVYKLLIDHYNDGRDLQEIHLVELDLEESLKNKYSVVSVYLESISETDWTVETIEKELDKLLPRWLEWYKMQEKPRLAILLKEAEKSNDKEKRNELLEQTIKLDSISIH